MWLDDGEEAEALSADLSVWPIAGFCASRFPGSAPSDLPAACPDPQPAQPGTAHHRNASVLQCHSIRPTEQSKVSLTDAWLSAGLCKNWQDLVLVLQVLKLLF